MKIFSKLMLGCMSVLSLAAVAAPASAQGWGDRHDRDHYRMHRIHDDRGYGDNGRGWGRGDRAFSMHHHGYRFHRDHRDY